MRPGSIALILMGTAMLILNGPVVYLAVRKFGLKGYWSRNPYEALPQWALPWVRAPTVVLAICFAVKVIFYP
jgi:hypothetical protein